MKSFKQFIGTFKKFDVKYLYVILLDLMFWLLSIFSFSLWSSTLKRNYLIAGDSLEVVSSMADYTANYPELIGHKAVLANFVNSSIWYTVLMILYIFIMWCLFRAIIWNVILKKDVSFKYVKRFFLLNLLWQPFNIILVILFGVILTLINILVTNFMVYLFDKGVWIYALWAVSIIPLLFVVIPVALFVVNLTNISYIYFTLKPKVKDSLKQMLETAMFKMRTLYVVYVYMALVLIILSFILLPLRAVSEKVYLGCSLVVFIVYFTWQKFWLSEIVK